MGTIMKHLPVATLLKEVNWPFSGVHSSHLSPSLPFSNVPPAASPVPPPATGTANPGHRPRCCRHQHSHLLSNMHPALSSLCPPANTTTGAANPGHSPCSCRHDQPHPLLNVHPVAFPLPSAPLFLPPPPQAPPIQGIVPAVAGMINLINSKILLLVHSHVSTRD